MCLNLLTAVVTPHFTREHLLRSGIRRFDRHQDEKKSEKQHRKLFHLILL
jgi:hypothetical protein